MSAQTRRGGKGDEAADRKSRYLDLLEQAKDLTQRGKRAKIFAQENLSEPFLQVLQAFKENRPIKLPELLTIEKARKLGILVIGPDEVNHALGTSLKLTDCPITFSLDEVLLFFFRVRADFKSANPHFALILLPDEICSGSSIDLRYLDKHFHLDCTDAKLRANYAKHPVRRMWVLMSCAPNPVYCSRNWYQQKELAQKRRDQILSIAEVALCHILIEQLTRLTSSSRFSGSQQLWIDLNTISLGSDKKAMDFVCVTKGNSPPEFFIFKQQLLDSNYQRSLAAALIAEF